MTTKLTSRGAAAEVRPALLNERYRVTRALGQGATSTVFSVVDQQSGEQRAVKLLHRDANESLMRTEFERLSRIKHPHLVRVHDLDRLHSPFVHGESSFEPGRLFLVLDLVDGLGPQECLGRTPAGQRDGRLRQIAEGLATALEHLHTHGLVHHDVKPDNVLLDREGRAVLLDLGLATRADQRGGWAARGTLPYLAPEALESSGDHRVDLYGLGATLYHLAARRPPFESHGSSLVRAILEDEPALDLPWLQSGIRRLILKLLSKDPLARPGSARVVLAELARLRGDDDAVAELSARRELLGPAFVGRTVELGELGRVLDGVTHTSVLLVVGDAGMGKTKLLEEALRAQRIRTALGRCKPVEVLAGNGPHILAMLGGSEASQSGAWGQPAEGLALRLLELLEERARRGPAPLVVIVRDAESDPWAMQLLRLLARASEPNDAGPPLLILAEVHPGSPLLAMPGEQHRLRRLELGPLAPAETAQLVSSMLGTSAPATIAGRIHGLSQGCPLLARELVQQYHAHGEAGLDLERVASLDVLAARRRQWLEPEQRLALDALALWAEAASVSELEELTALPRQRVWTIIEALAANATIVREAPASVRLPSLAHVQAWRRVLAREGGARELHRRAAELLRGAEGPARARLAEHLLAAGEQGAAAVALAAAKELVAAHAVAAAVHLLEQVLRSASGELRSEAVPLLARLLLQTARYDEALALLTQDDVPSALLRAQVLQKRGDYQAAEAVLRAITPRLVPGSAECQQAIALLGRLMLHQGRAAEALAVTSPEAKAHAAGSEGPLTAEAAALLEIVGLAQWYLGDLAQAEELFSSVVRRLGTDGAPQLLGRFVGMQGMVAMGAGEYRKAAEHYERALRLARSAGDVHGATHCLGNLGAASLYAGHFGEALACFSKAARDLSRLGHTTELASALCNIANLLLMLGDLDRAEATLERAAQLAHRLDGRHTQGYVLMLEGDLWRRRNDLRQAIARYQQAWSLFREIGAQREQLSCQLTWVDALIEAKEVEDARRRLATLTAESGMQGEVALSWARLALTGGEEALALLPRDVEAALAGHCARLEQQGADKELWRTALVLGRLLAATGRPSSARKALQRAKQTWEEIVTRSPEIYQEQLAMDPDARSLAAVWPTLLEEPSAETARAGNLSRALPTSGGGHYEDSRWYRRLLALNKRLNSELRLPRLLELILDTAIELAEAERGFLLLVEADATLSIKVARNIDRQSLEGEELSLSRSIAEQAARSGEPVVAIDAAEDLRFQQALSVSDLRLRSVLAVPLQLKGRSVGTIYVDHRLKRSAFGEAQIGLLQDIAEQAAIAIENARLLTENKRKAREIGLLNQQLQRRLDNQEAELCGVREELRSSRQALQLRHDYKNIVGRTARMVELFRLLDRVTETELPVVIYGESGTGKELVARAIHCNGPRSSRPFVGENCGAIPETLLESVLFGHVRGAFTGADRDRKGLFEVASGGTLFLDEVGEMSPAMQTKLLRVLQDGELRRVGGTQTIRTEVRVVAASNRDLEQLVSQGRFREDLYYRLNVVQIRLPALRERREDIPLLVDHFLKKHAPKAERRVSPAAMARLMGHGWPGNVRELENEIMRAVALGDAVIGPEDLSPHIGGAVPLALNDPDDLDLRVRVQHLERELIQRALKRASGNHTRAAEMLGLSRFGLLKKLQRYDTARDRDGKRQLK